MTVTSIAFVGVDLHADAAKDQIANRFGFIVRTHFEKIYSFPRCDVTEAGLLDLSLVPVFFSRSHFMVIRPQILNSVLHE